MLRISHVGLRGVVGDGWTASHVLDFASAFGTFLEPGCPVVIGRGTWVGVRRTSLVFQEQEHRAYLSGSEPRGNKAQILATPESVVGLLAHRAAARA